MKTVLHDFIRSKYFLLFLAVEILAAVITFMEMKSDDSLTSIQRNDPGKGTIHKELMVSSDNDNWQEIEVEVSEKSLSGSDASALLKQAKEDVIGGYLGENDSPDNIWEDLSLSGEYAGGSVNATWSFDPSEYIEAGGAIKRSLIREPIAVKASCTLSIGSRRDTLDINIRIVPPSADTPEGLSHLIEVNLEDADLIGGDEVTLPTELGGNKLRWKQKDSGYGPQLAVFGLIAAIGIVFGTSEDKKRQYKLRQKELSIDYPDIVSKLSLYLGAGFSVKKSFEQIAVTYKHDLDTGRKRSSPGYEGICELCRSISDGVGEIEAYREFSRRMGHRDYRKLVMLLTQSLRKGNRDLLYQLEAEEENAFEDRKNRAKIAGEEASTKLLLPMMGLLLVVMLVLIVPALMTIS